MAGVEAVAVKSSQPLALINSLHALHSFRQGVNLSKHKRGRGPA